MKRNQSNPSPHPSTEYFVAAPARFNVTGLLVLLGILLALVFLTLAFMPVARTSGTRAIPFANESQLSGNTPYFKPASEPGSVPTGFRSRSELLTQDQQSQISHLRGEEIPATVESPSTTVTSMQASPNLAIDPYGRMIDITLRQEVTLTAPWDHFGFDSLPANPSYEIQPLNYLFTVSVEAGRDAIGGRPSIAFDGTNFFTVWKDPRNSNTSSTDVYGTFIARDGTLLNPSGFAIGRAVDTDYVPSVVFDGTNYVVTWVSGGGVTDIYAARVAPNGTVLDTPAARITNGADPKFRPISLAFDGTNYLIVWRSSSDEIRGTRVSKSLVSLDGPTGFGIGGGFYPWVAFNGTNYLVVWHGHGANGLDVFGARVDRNGTVIAPGVITISSDLNDQDHASVASDGTDFLIAWHDYRGTNEYGNGSAYAARVSAAGVVLDNPTIKVSDHTLWQVPVQTVYDGSNYFVAWHVDSEANYRLSDVVGRRVSSAGAVLDQQTIPLAASYGHQFGPVMGYGDGRYLVEWNATGGCDFHGSSCIRGQILQKRNTQSATNRENLTSQQLPTANRVFSSTSSNPWIAEQSNTGNWLHNIWAFDESHVYVSTEADDGTVLGYDGNAWTTVAHAQNARKFGLWGTGPSEIWTVGWCWDIVRYDGTTTDHVNCVDFPPFETHGIGMGVWASSKLNIMTVGGKGGFFHYEGTDFASQPGLDRGNWRDKPTGVPVDLWDIWGTAANNVYAVGEFGTVIRYDGSNWTKQNNIPTGQSLNAIWGSSAHDIFAVGDSGAIIHYDGSSWTTQATPTVENLYGVWGWSGSSVYAVGAYGTILHYDGANWALEASGTNVVLSDVGGAANTVRAVGDHGVILKKAERDCTGSLAPSSNSFPGSGGSGIVGVTASGGCNWTAVSNDSWITVTSAASGAGNGAVTYSVSPNLEIGSRTGTITVAGQALAVNQSPASTPMPTPTPKAVQFSSANYGVTEDCTTVTLTVNRLGDTSSAATVDYSTSNVTASERRDYITALGKLTFAPGETSKSFAVLINEDSYVEGPETFNVSLSNPSGAGLGGPVIAIVTITDDTTEPATNVIDDPGNFVCQHYHDFLNRQPDASGLNFWTNQITSCGIDAPCIEVRRINVSASFFLSIEFQETGYLVERLYKAAYGDASGTSTFPLPHQLPVPSVRFAEFLTDTQQIGQGVIVNQPGWQTVLENNKQAFALAFVQRPRFYAAFPTSMTPAQFVDKLFQNAGVTPAAADRNAAINEFSGTPDISNMTACSRALRDVAENATLSQQETNRAFVLMQYYGYLGRNPNDPQDTDYTGYDFWLTKLNQFNGNFINAEMVKAFITSIEYRQRFGP